MPIVKIENVFKQYGATEVLKGVSLDVESGQVVAIIVASGSWKITLLRCLNGLEQITSGKIEIVGHVLDDSFAHLRQLRKDVGIVFQSYNLFPHLTVGENIMLAPRITKGISREETRRIAEATLAQVGLTDKFGAYPEKLSGGQQQRVAIARSLAMQPKVMLFDEVTSALDPQLTGEVLIVMEKLAEGGMTMLLVTHEMGFAKSVADITVFMHRGKVWEVGPSKELFSSPKSSELQQFIGGSLK
jgi:polar amino acid transport system ATP-binding protein